MSASTRERSFRVEIDMATVPSSFTRPSSFPPDTLVSKEKPMYAIALDVDGELLQQDEIRKVLQSHGFS